MTQVVYNRYIPICTIMSSR